MNNMFARKPEATPIRLRGGGTFILTSKTQPFVISCKRDSVSTMDCSITRQSLVDSAAAAAISKSLTLKHHVTVVNSSKVE